MSSKKEIMKLMLLRKPTGNLKRLHPQARKIMNAMTQVPKPLTYKLQEIKDNSPQSQFIPLGNTSQLPFFIGRSFNGNLPVYSKYRFDRASKRTVIRHVQGDIDSFTSELKKVVSNSEIYVKVGRIEVKGMHQESVRLWLHKLGF